MKFQLLQPQSVCRRLDGQWCLAMDFNLNDATIRLCVWGAPIVVSLHRKVYLNRLAYSAPAASNSLSPPSLRRWQHRTLITRGRLASLLRACNTASFGCIVVLANLTTCAHIFQLDALPQHHAVTLRPGCKVPYSISLAP